MSYQEALNRINKAKESNATKLDLSELNLESIPIELFELTQLTTLYLQSNQINSIPDSLANLQNLATLYLHFTSTPVRYRSKF